ncbi:histidine kinase [Flavobacterium sp. MXW15]|uniref:Histidine kinase n=1 Tax=Xanthomonas chitinilytica TaxID=2989819 RepID=A0ABT3JUU3_9XANT|nr:histidine kinase [Xanthomonas sp. H13-6]MCW4453369.1 histidine kinase [Flavobacterium sp. MXW15]MCW4472278.1 histidine kinase [Xanthomonas sp. H13-6]
MTMKTDYPLRQVLPPEVLLGGGMIWSRYRQYPVFSLRWLGGRSLVFCSVIAVCAAFIGAATGLTVQDPMVALKAGLTQFAAFSLMATLGPALATAVRYRRWSEPYERKAVVVAVLIGMLLSFLVDRFASAYVASLITPGLAKLGMATTQPAMGPVVTGLILAINVVGLVIIYGLFGGGLALRAYFSERARWQAHRHRRELDGARQQARDADLRLGVLQAQVEPHFLFNTLASVRALVRHDPAQAEATLDALADFLRATIPRLRDGEAALHSTLGQQLDICATYLALMQVRMGGRLRYDVQADAGQRAHPFPPALLITLVENAIKHGIEPRPGAGRVDIVATVQDGRLRVRVADDGAGLKPGLGSGMGLANVREQLAQRFGDRAGLRLQPREGHGVVAEIEVPWEGAA